MNTVALASVAALGLLLFGLGLAVSLLRFRKETLFGQPDDPNSLLCKLVRAHGNTAEYAGLIAVLVLYLGSRSPAPWVVWVMGAITACRYVLVAGLVFPASLARPNVLRFVGALGTYACGAALCAALISGA
ncbi:MAG TPA: MAPEG family protein [Burkholderiaceae bacterium]|nr:MAPEG family protein [Burkholderiaceae bacterium]